MKTNNISSGVKAMKKNISGILYVSLIATLAIFIHHFFLNMIETMTIGILLGFLIANTIGNPESTKEGINFSLKKVLKWGIVLLGVQLNFNLVFELGPKILILIITLISLALITSQFLGKAFKINSKLAALLGVGSSICGASAIVAMGPVIDADDEDVAISVTVISLLGAIGVILYTILSRKLPLSQQEYGIWAGSSLQGVAHALAAAAAFGSQSISLQIGTLVKMARVALLGPVAMILSSIFSKTSKQKALHFPLYVFYFILVGLLFTLNSYFSILPTSFTIGSINIDIKSILKSLSDFFLLIAMVAMGLKVHLKSFERKALTALIVCSIIFLIVSLSSLSYILLFL